MSECRSAHIIPECMMKDWTSPVYAFFQPTPVIEEIGTRRSHVFKCCARDCKVTVRRYLDTTDAHSTGNMQKHAKKCWGSEALKAADSAKNAVEVCEKIVSSILHTGSITQSFERKGKGKVTYSHRQHMRTETNLCPFAIVKDRGFQLLMKTGRPEYYIPSKSTVSHDVWLVFARTQVRVAKMLKEYDGKLNFTTDAWTVPNHCALVAFSVHLEHKGTPLHFPLDVIEVAKSHTGEELAMVF
ncbi:hypothetical protein EV363DRAFT_1162111 [Boletus edulis]|nr:hypothetical protein EV363DRAFT_1162111 [Boletus edulis]